MDHGKRVDEIWPLLGALVRGIGSVAARAGSVGARAGAGATKAAGTTSKVGKFRQGLKLVRGMKQTFQDKRAAKKKDRLAADQTQADTDMVQPDAIKDAEQKAEFNRSMRSVRHSPGRPRPPRQDQSTHYITKAGVKFIEESRSGRKYPKRGRGWRRVITKAKGNDLPRVEVPKEKKIPQHLKGKALADALRQKDIEGLGFKGPMGRG